MGAVCLIVVCIMLSLGLWPFHAPRNNVAWMKNSNGVSFGPGGTVLSSGPLETPTVWGDPSGSIEVWLQPSHWDSATILALYRPEQGLLVTLRQSLADFEVTADVDHDSDRRTTGHFYVSDTFASPLQRKRTAFITVTSGPSGTRIYVDGALVKTAPYFWIPRDAFGGRLIVGDSPGQTDSFRGQIRGLALYATELNGEQVLSHYRDWIHKGRPNLDQEQHNLALYLFNEKTGDIVHNQSGGNGDLHIPATYMVVDKIALEPFWNEFNFSRAYWRGNFKNIIGFIPLGVCLCAYFSMAKPRRRAILLTVIWGAVVSLTIEVFQAVLPTRDSGTTDIITNTLGTWIGVLCYLRFYQVLAGRFPPLRRFAPGSNH